MQRSECLPMRLYISARVSVCLLVCVCVYIHLMECQLDNMYSGDSNTNECCLIAFCRNVFALIYFLEKERRKFT